MFYEKSSKGTLKKKRMNRVQEGKHTECRTQGLPPEGPGWGARVRIHIVKSPGFFNTQVLKQLKQPSHVQFSGLVRLSM